MKVSFLVMLGVLMTGAALAQEQPAGTAATVAVAAKGKMVVAANGARLGSVYRVNPDGSAQLILDGKMVTIPAVTLSNANGRLMTSLSRSEVSDLR